MIYIVNRNTINYTLLEKSKLEIRSQIIVNEVNKKNSAIAPGLTVVYWGNADKQITNQIQIVKEKFKKFKKIIKWYSLEHVHITLTALIRTQYGNNLPLNSDDLPINFPKIVPEIAQIQPFEISIDRYALRKDGQIQLVGIVENENIERLRFFREIARKLDPTYQFLNKPKQINGVNLHMNFGYFVESPTIEFEPFEENINNDFFLRVSRVSIVHYLKRTLENKYLVGQIHVPLNQKTEISEALFREQLGII